MLNARRIRRLLDVLPERPHRLHVHTGDGILFLVHAAERVENAGVAAGERGHQYQPALRQRLCPRIGRVGARVHLGLRVGVEVGPLLRRLFDLLLANLLPSGLELH